MPTHNANGRLTLWRRVRAYAVPPSMIGTATARRRAGDWAGACAAARVDVDLDPRTVSRRYGQEFAALLRTDLRRLAPDLLRWHLPRIAPDGLLRPGLTVPLARYDGAGADGRSPIRLVVRTAPAWADAGQRISLALWDPSARDAASHRHPHPVPSRRHRLDLHRHLWDADRAGELRARSGAGAAAGGERAGRAPWPEPVRLLPPERRYAVGRWADEAGVLLAEEHRAAGSVLVRLGGRARLVLDVARDGGGAWRITGARHPRGSTTALPVLPDAATWIPPDLDLLAAGLIGPHELHPLVALALVPGHHPAPAPSAAPARRAGEPGVVECRGALHRIAPVDGVLVPLDHDPAELRREELLAALGGPPMPCLRAVDEAHRSPECLPGVRERLAHGDVDGALDVVTALLGPQAVLRAGELLDELDAAVEQRAVHGMFRAGLAERLHGVPRHVLGAPLTDSYRRAVRRRALDPARR
ncbi:hypothetical protein [Streptomyces abyssomicinicus]|uniref:hypothetical protein n=1 Tax=Streptomyces abyssomicinicus TaxID=574929 RepID=UPI00158153EA|nr:hypothetical protein [Streptomyces abyssomicinicus]